LASERSEQRAARPRPRAAYALPGGWQPGLRRGPPSGDAVSAAARTSPPLAALTGVPYRPFVRKPRSPSDDAPPGGWPTDARRGPPGAAVGAGPARGPRRNAARGGALLEVMGKQLEGAPGNCTHRTSYAAIRD
jgi:hypothetical protein